MAVHGLSGAWTERDAWDTLCRIIVNETGVDRDVVKPDTAIVDDLGLD